MTRLYDFDGQNTTPRQGMSYQQAKDIRKKSLSSLLIDELMTEGTTVGGSIKSALSQKSQARMTGIKQAFDPMNVVKFMTFGSSLAPALLGKMTGRSREDMGFFAGGKAKQVANKATKIDELEKGDEGLITVLSQIYSLLKKSHEDEVLKRQLDKNQSEERELEEERRHKELLKALGVTVTKDKTVDKELPESDVGITDIVTDIINSFGGMKKITEVGKWFVMGTGATLLGIVGAAALGGWLGSLVADYRDKKEAENQKKYDDQTQEESLKADISEVEKLPNNPIKPSDVNKQQEYANLFEIRIQKGQKFTAKEAEILKNKLSVYVPKNQIIEQTAAPAQPASSPAPTAAPAAAESSGTPPVTQSKTSTSSTAAAEPPTPPSAQVTSASNENVSLQLGEKIKPESDSTVTTNKIVANESKNDVARSPLPAIRNLEPTFQRMIYASTRVV